MKVTRDVILDLLPVYWAGEASADTRALVEEFTREDPELARRIRLQWAENFEKTAPAALPPEMELKSLRRTRAVLGWQRWLFGFGIAFTALSLSSEFSFKNGRLAEFHFLMRDDPLMFGTCLGLGVACWITYALIRRSLRTTPR